MVFSEPGRTRDAMARHEQSKSNLHLAPRSSAKGEVPVMGKTPKWPTWKGAGWDFPHGVAMVKWT